MTYFQKDLCKIEIRSPVVLNETKISLMSKN